jgi:Excalibur calcium-binding domain
MVAIKRLACVIAALTVASACGTPPTNTASPIIQTPATTSSSTTSTTTSTTTTSTTTTLAVPPVTVPADLAGKSAAGVETQLKNLGFKVIKYLDPDGKPVAADSTWTVASVDLSGVSVAPDTSIYVRVSKPTPPPAPKATPKTVEPEPVEEPPAAAYYKNCTAAKAAGAAPLHLGEPGYRSALDRDHDGIACE